MDGLLDLQVNQAVNLAFTPNVSSSQVTASNKNDAVSAGKQFEAMFMTQMVEQMFTSDSAEGMFGGGQSEKIYRSMLSKEYATQMTESGGLGIAEMVTKQILSLQEEANK